MSSEATVADHIVEGMPSADRRCGKVSDPRGVSRIVTAFTRAPKGCDAAEAATITIAGLTAWQALVVDAKLKADDMVLPLGTGGVSIWALQIAKRMDAQVTIASSSGEKLNRAKAMGADFTLSYREQLDWGRVARLDQRSRDRSRRRGRRHHHALTTTGSIGG